MSELLRNLNEEMAAVVAGVQSSLVQISNGRRGHGAGTVWHGDGLILTNAHVIAGHRVLNVTLPDGRTLPARLLASDRERDLAALAIDAHGLPTISLGNARQIQTGHWVVALGHPWGVLGAISAGTVIGVGRPPEMPNYPGDLIQVGLHLRPGHSGGPLVDSRGRLVGINTMIAGPNVGLAIPLYVVKKFLKKFLGRNGDAD